jgi:hypothetical protein
VDSTDEFRSRHIQAVSVNVDSDDPFQLGVFHSAGHPDHADGTIVGGTHAVVVPVTSTPFGSPGRAEGGPTVPGGFSAGSLSFGVSGGRIARVNKPTVVSL